MISPDLHWAMLRIRMVERAIADRYRRGHMRCPVHLSIGQEAAAVGVAAALRPVDVAFSTHRCHAHYLALGGDLQSMIDELHGLPMGCNGGRGGSMHLQSDRLVASLPIVGSALPVAAGWAWADAMAGRDRVTVVFLGDAALEEGAWHETANLARLKRLPLFFVVENNQFSIHTPIRQRQPMRPLTDLALAHGIPAANCPGNDVESVRIAAAAAVDSIRREGGPRLLVIDVWRWAEHCGVDIRPDHDAELWRALDPLGSFEPPEEFGADAAEIDRAFDRAEAANG